MFLVYLCIILVSIGFVSDANAAIHTDTNEKTFALINYAEGISLYNAVTVHITTTDNSYADANGYTYNNRSMYYWCDYASNIFYCETFILNFTWYYNLSTEAVTRQFTGWNSQGSIFPNNPEISGYYVDTTPVVYRGTNSPSLYGAAATIGFIDSTFPSGNLSLRVDYPLN